MRSFWRSAAILSAVLVSVSVSALGAVRVQAQEMDDGDYIRARASHYREIGTSFKAISDELKSGAPRPGIIRMAANDILAQAKSQYGWFRAGSGPESEEKTKAKPEIWTRAKDFRAAQDRFLGAAGAMATAANSPADPKTLIPQFKDLGASCSGCHTNFRAE